GRLRSRAHLVLANGSITKKKNETTAAAHKRDQNEAARAKLKARNVEIHDRMVSPGALGHNKFLVITDSAEKPNSAWTGSTNWTATGLCTQLNNGLLVRDPGVASIYLKQWNRLRDAKSGFPASLVSSNSKPKTGSIGRSRMNVWFTRTTGQV